MPLKIGLIGVGHMGRIHLQKLMAIKDIQVVGIVDKNAGLAEDIAKTHHVPFYTEHMQIIDGLNGVVIASPTETHHAIAKTFLSNGIHVFIEKPIASSIEEAKDLVALANNKNVLLQIGHLERLNPAYKKALPYIRKPVFIETRRTSNFTGRSTDIDVVLDLMIHDIDLILSFVKEDPKHIDSYGIPFVGDKLDTVHSIVAFARCTASLFASRVATKKERSITVYEKDRIIFIDLLNGQSVCNIKNEQGVIETIEFASESIDSVMDELSGFVCSMMGEASNCAKGEDGLKALTLAGQIKENIA